MDYECMTVYVAEARRLSKVCICAYHIYVCIQTCVTRHIVVYLMDNDIYASKGVCGIVSST